jgi:2-methylcitrate dehydratase PrpD
VRAQVRRCVLDGLGAAIGGTRTPVASIAAQFVRDTGKSGPASVLASGDRLAVAPAVFANATAANALDIDDGYRPAKGHPGGFVVMPAIAACQERGARRFLTSVVAGYEIAARAAVATHRGYAHFHASGSWGALGTAACLGRILELDEEAIRWALGLAEYHAALSPIERCLGTPAMSKDGIGWGAYAGACAAYLAEKGYTGNPSLAEDDANDDLFSDLGQRWRMLDLYFKPYACCRWAQQGVDALFALREAHGFRHEEVRSIVVHTFREATLLQKTAPRNTEEAQYHLFWPLAAALVRGKAGPDEVTGEALHDIRMVELLNRMACIAEPDIQARFPREALAWIEVELNSGTRLKSGLTAARGDAHIPLSDAELVGKFVSITAGVIGEDTSRVIVDAVSALDEGGPDQHLIDVIGAIRVRGQR